MGHESFLCAMLLAVILIAPAGCAVATPATPVAAGALTFDGGSVYVTIIAVSNSEIRRNDVQIILAPPDRGPFLVVFPESVAECNATLSIASNVPAVPNAYLSAGDFIKIQSEPGQFATGQWKLFMIYSSTRGTMMETAWNSTADHQLIHPSAVDFPADPMAYYGFEPATAIDGAAIMMVVLAVIGGSLLAYIVMKKK
ncbi:MAG: hypothetical protein LUO79_05520 [Methanomassiliicoccales archaeon]|nr:hypothetical protein [Methanomassiliicoccales archaeon]